MKSDREETGAACCGSCKISNCMNECDCVIYNTISATKAHFNLVVKGTLTNEVISHVFVLGHDSNVI